MSNNITLKNEYVPSDGWRGFYRPVYWVAGANDTGSWSDSPCPTRVASAELRSAARILAKAGIEYKYAKRASSNVFMMRRFIVVSPDDNERARRILSKAFEDKYTQLLYINKP